jgi:hypothetical protein
MIILGIISKSMNFSLWLKIYVTFCEYFFVGIKGFNPNTNSVYLPCMFSWKTTKYTNEKKNFSLPEQQWKRKKKQQ